MDMRIVYTLLVVAALGGFLADWAFNGNHAEKKAEAEKTLQAENAPMRGIDDVEPKKDNHKRKKKPQVDVELVDESVIGD